MKKVSAILTSDWHLRSSVPPCRTDDFETAQWTKVQFISDLQKTHNCPIIHAGDLFDHWKPSLHLLSKTIKNLPNQFYTIYGNHDLPQHSLELTHKTGTNVLNTAEVLTVLSGTHWGQVPAKESLTIEGRKILVWHVMTYQGKTFPGDTSAPSRVILRKYQNYDLILTGHNHQSFMERSPYGNVLVNPGGITRQESDESEKQPRIYLWYAEDNSVEVVDIPIQHGVVQKSENSQKLEERSERIDAFISKLNEDWDTTVNFEKNLELFLSVNVVPQEVVEIVLNAIGK